MAKLAQTCKRPTPTPPESKMALSPFIGLELRTVFKLHSAFAGLCGALATLAPSFFGQVLP